ncbi:MAG TPA: hypothetical protein VGK32_12230 [Vicinamibacterales bacterium]|jgi:hypothetical protein
MENSITRDHIPPKVLLAEPFPPNLLTVPACLDCNRGFQRDDDYTRIVLALDLRAQTNRSAAEKLPAIFRSLTRPEAMRFTDSLRSSVSPSSVVDANGRPLGSVFKPDVSRIEATGKHIARGLHFSFCGQALPLDYRLYVHSKPGYDSFDFFVPHFERFYAKCSAHREGRVGDVFSYVAASAGDAYAWLLLLYEYFWWAVIAVPPTFGLSQSG